MEASGDESLAATLAAHFGQDICVTKDFNIRAFRHLGQSDNGVYKNTFCTL